MIGKRMNTTKACATCGETFQPWNSLSKFCSKQCANARPDRPFKRTVRTLVCATCEKEFQIYPSDNNWGAKRKFCSRACTGASPEVRAARAEKNRDRQGKANPNFRHGRRIGENIRTFTLALKGEEFCRNCGRPQEHLHHVLPRSFYRAGRGELLNGLPLCAKCHVGWHHRKVSIFRDVFTEEEWAYLTSVQLAGQEVVPWLDERYPERSVGEVAA